MRDATDEETAEILEALMGYVSVMPDPRQDQGKDQGKRHALGMMIVMALTAVLSGADDWADVVAFSESQKGWLSELCRMPHGVPCVSTFENVFSMLAPKAFSRILIELSERLVQNKRKDRQIAIDGKRLRCSFDDACKQGGLHLLHAFGVQTGLLLGQEATDSKENAIVAMPRLLRMLDIRGKTVSVDAMLTQTSIAEQIKEQGGEYVMALKDNHPTLHRHVQQRFEFAARMQYQTTRMGQSFGYHSTGSKVDKEHGRLEVRKVSGFTRSIPDGNRSKAWCGLNPNTPWAPQTPRMTCATPSAPIRLNVVSSSQSAYVTTGP